MTVKRFKLGYVCGDYGLIDNDEWIDLHSMSENSEKNVQICINKMNELADENEQLKFERDRYKRLSEIRHELINNRILTIKEFIDNCSDKEVKKTLEQLFHSEVKEYDLSKKIRKLEKENEQLKKDLIDHSALISMLEDYQALKIEETLWNLTGAKSEEEFNELYKPYLDKAKRCWR
jgi:hypothetical protein